MNSVTYLQLNILLLGTRKFQDIKPKRKKAVKNMDRTAYTTTKRLAPEMWDWNGDPYSQRLLITVLAEGLGARIKQR